MYEDYMELAWLAERSEASLMICSRCGGDIEKITYEQEDEAQITGILECFVCREG